MQATRRMSALALTTLAALGLAAAAPQAARAQLYTSSANFNSALAAGSYTEPFNGGSGGAFASRSFSGGSGYAYTVTASGTGGSTGIPLVYRGGGIISTNSNTDSLVFTFTGSPVTAVGGNFFATDIDNNVVFSNVMLTLSTGQTVSFTTASANTFRGYVSDVAITSLTESVSPGTFATADNFTVGTSNAVTPAPEPSSVAAFAFTGLGAAALILRARKRRA